MSVLASKPTSIITFLLDRSGSMGSCKPATIEAFNAYLAGLQEETEVAISFTHLLFDTASLDKVCVDIPVSDARPLTDETYVPRGGTPLIDAAVKTIRAVEAALTARPDKPKVVVCIQTDGEENSSVEHTWEELRGIVTAKTEQGWQFNFMGAGIDGYVQAARMGVGAGSTVSYDIADAGRTRMAFAASAANVRSFVSGQSMNTEYSASQRTASGDRFADRHGLTGVTVTTTVQPATVPLRPAVIQPDLTTKKPVQRPRRKAVVADFKL